MADDKQALPVNREEALELLRSYVHQENLIKHCLATEAIMRSLAERFGEDPEKWGIAGLLHDLDYEETYEIPEQHARKTAEILKEKGFPQDMIDAILAHNAEALGIERTTRFDFAITCSECITGLITATTLVYPDKKLKSVKPKSITKRMKEKGFARSVNRDLIRLCEKIDIPLPEFAVISLEAMRGIDEELGL
jgi:putative nucleotidyltransferase with HDIG domain